jgi:hypothetical protein
MGRQREVERPRPSAATVLSRLLDEEALPAGPVVKVELNVEASGGCGWRVYIEAQQDPDVGYLPQPES